jgi:hypothetical protein
MWTYFLSIMIAKVVFRPRMAAHGRCDLALRGLHCAGGVEGERADRRLGRHGALEPVAQDDDRMLGPLADEDRLAPPGRIVACQTKGETK